MNPLSKPIPTLRTLVREADLERAQEDIEQARLYAQYEKEMGDTHTLDDIDDDLGSFFDLLEPDVEEPEPNDPGEDDLSGYDDNDLWNGY